MVKSENHDRIAILTKPGLNFEVQDGGKFLAEPYKR